VLPVVEVIVTHVPPVVVDKWRDVEEEVLTLVDVG
jgi:hypothetical protein